MSGEERGDAAHQLAVQSLSRSCQSSSDCDWYKEAGERLSTSPCSSSLHCVHEGQPFYCRLTRSVIGRQEPEVPKHLQNKINRLFAVRWDVSGRNATASALEGRTAR